MVHRRFRSVALVLAVASSAVPLACGRAPVDSATPWTRIESDDRFVCINRPVAGVDTGSKVDHWSLDLTQFACRFRGSVDCVLWVSEVAGRHEYLIDAPLDVQQEVIVAMGAVGVWPSSLSAEISERPAGGRSDASTWSIGTRGELTVGVPADGPISGK